MEPEAELCGKNRHGVLWQICRFSGTLTLSTFEQEPSKKKYYTKNGDVHGRIQDLAYWIEKKEICRDQLKWYPNSWREETDPEPELADFSA